MAQSEHRNRPRGYRGRRRGQPLLSAECQVSKTKLREAEIAIQILLKVLARGQIDLTDIVIFTPFKAQQKLLRKAAVLACRVLSGLTTAAVIGLRLSGRPTRHRQVGRLQAGYRTVQPRTTHRQRFRHLLYSPQQQTCKIVLLQGRLGEVYDFRILNSVLLKARKGCVVLGNVGTLSSSNIWKDFCIWAQNNSLLIKST
jgi:hypothetical protein